MKKKAKRKPSTKRSREWLKQAKWLTSYLEQLPDTPSAHGLEWTRKMVIHYTSKFDELLKITPRACRKQAKSYKDRVERIRNWSKRVN